MPEHRGEYEIFDQMWSREEMFYNEGNVAGSRTFLELWESVKVQHLAEEFLRKTRQDTRSRLRLWRRIIVFPQYPRVRSGPC